VTVTVAKDPAALDQETRTVGGIDFKMRYIPSGAFMKPEKGSDILVQVPTGFWIAETETTQELYQFIMGENPSIFKDNPAPGEVQSRRPVNNLIWYEAVLFCNRLSIASGREPVYHIWGVSDWEKYLKWAIDTQSNSAESNIFIDEKANGYRLPTTNEWVWAAIGADIQNPGQVNTLGAKKNYSGGPVGSNAGIENFAWCYNNSSFTTHEVGRLLCNELGLFDMTGNVMEWVWKSVIAGGEWGTTGDITIPNNMGKATPFERLEVCGIRLVSNQ
jgi:formylglycine-generating enzyme required for sulfatase activity